MYLVTGGGGFIGSHLVKALVSRGMRVRVLDNGFSGSQARIADVAGDVEWIDGDIRDAAVVRAACAGVEVVLHHAAIASVPYSVAHPEETHETNVTGTLNVLQAAHACGVRRVVFASSSAVYGELAVTPKREDLATVPVSPYGAQKLAAEAYCRVWHTSYGLETVALRYFNVFGPNQNPKSEYAAVIPRFVTAALAGRALTIYGDGEQSRDFIPVQNVVEINLAAAVDSRAVGQVLNVGLGNSTTLNMLVTLISDIACCPVNVIHEEKRSGDVRESLADISQLTNALEYVPSTTLRDGLVATISAFAELSKLETLSP
jgi:UDP-glucose 4-epimerase